MSSLIVMHNSQIMLLEVAVKNVSNYTSSYFTIIIYSLVIFFYTILMIKVKVGFRNTIDNIENIEIFVAFNERLTYGINYCSIFFFF